MILNPFELRYLVERNYGQTDNPPLSNLLSEDIDDRSYKKPVFRYVINMSKPDSPKLIPPQRYYEIEKEEDRVFRPEYVPLFRKKKGTGLTNSAKIEVWNIYTQKSLLF